MARVLVQHSVRYDSHGNATGTRYEKVGQVVLDVTHFYLQKDNGNPVCRVSCGDIWAVRPVQHDKYEFVTV